MARVRIDNVSKVYPGGVQAVRDVSLDIEDKEFFVLVGPSGCGKSTLLRMIAGLEEITQGEISIGDRVINEVAPKDRDIAMVFQNYALYPHMTVYKNMAFGLQLRRFKKDEIDRRVREAAQILGIDELLDRRPKALSGGQRQRVAVGRAIVRQPQVFLFDEPLSNLDAKLRTQMRTEIAKLHERLRATMVYVTHDQVEAMTMGDRIAVLLDGVVQQAADPMTLYDKPVNRFVAGFIGSPPMNFFDGVVEAEGDQLFFNAGAMRLPVSASAAPALAPLAGGKVVFGIRPEHIHDASFTGLAGLQAKVASTVEVVEPMGSESYLYMSVDESSFVARLQGHFRSTTGQEIPLLFNLEKSHYFDHETGESLA